MLIVLILYNNRKELIYQAASCEFHGQVVFFNRQISTYRLFKQPKYFNGCFFCVTNSEYSTRAHPPGFVFENQIYADDMMQKYRKSNYAINKYKKEIVYQFQDGIRGEITSEQYLKENQDKCEEDFRKLKELSDAIYHEQVNEEMQYARKTSRIEKLEETFHFYKRLVLSAFLYALSYCRGPPLQI